MISKSNLADTQRDLDELCMSEEGVLSVGEDDQYYHQQMAQLPGGGADANDTTIMQTIVQSIQPREDRFHVHQSLRAQYFALFLLERGLSPVQRSL